MCEIFNTLFLNIGAQSYLYGFDNYVLDWVQIVWIIIPLL